MSFRGCHPILPGERYQNPYAFSSRLDFPHYRAQGSRQRIYAGGHVTYLIAPNVRRIKNRWPDLTIPWIRSIHSVLGKVDGHFKLFTLVLLVCIAPFPGRASQVASSPSPDLSKFMWVYCMLVDSGERQTENQPPATAAESRRALRQEFDLAPEDWNEVATSCRSVLTEISTLANEARDTQKRQGGVMSAAQVSGVNLRLAAQLRNVLDGLQVRLSTSGRTSLRLRLSTLASNTTTVRIKDGK